MDVPSRNPPGPAASSAGQHRLRRGHRRERASLLHPARPSWQAADQDAGSAFPDLPAVIPSKNLSTARSIPAAITSLPLWTRSGVLPSGDSQARQPARRLNGVHRKEDRRRDHDSEINPVARSPADRTSRRRRADALGRVQANCRDGPSHPARDPATWDRHDGRLRAGAGREGEGVIELVLFALPAMQCARCNGNTDLPKASA